jgi:ribosomal protein S8
VNTFSPKKCLNRCIVRSNSSCPVDRIKLNKSFIREPTFIIKNIYINLQLKCKYESNRCHKIRTIEQVKRRQSICKFNDNLMSGCDKGCGDDH